jgi:hypothetical protein
MLLDSAGHFARANSREPLREGIITDHHNLANLAYFFYSVQEKERTRRFSARERQGRTCRDF